MITRLYADNYRCFVNFELHLEPLSLLLGVNGVGKTTAIARLTQLHLDEGQTVLLGAGDTFRAAAIEQLQTWGERLGVDVIDALGQFLLDFGDLLSLGLFDIDDE